jgi:hypothetical protein
MRGRPTCRASFDAGQFGKAGAPVLDFIQHHFRQQVHMLPFQKKNPFIGLGVCKLGKLLPEGLFDHIVQVDVDLLSADVQNAGFIGGSPFERRDPDIEWDVEWRNAGNAGDLTRILATAPRQSEPICPDPLLYSLYDAITHGRRLLSQRAHRNENFNPPAFHDQRMVLLDREKCRTPKEPKSSFSPMKGSMIVCSTANALPSVFRVPAYRRPASGGRWCRALSCPRPTMSGPRTPRGTA